MRITALGLELLGCVVLVFSMPQMPENGGDDGFGMVDSPPAVASAIDVLANMESLNMDRRLLQNLPQEVLFTLLKSLVNSDSMKNKMPVQEEEIQQNVVDPIEVCPESDKKGIPHYCKDLVDGMYQDPWNPWCGYIECAGGIPKRRVCKRGRWMDTKSRLGKTQQDMCQLPLEFSKEPCSMWTDMDMCRNAAKLATPEPAGPQTPPGEEFAES